MRRAPVSKIVLFLVAILLGRPEFTFPQPEQPSGTQKRSKSVGSPAMSAALQYAEAVSSGNRAVVGRLDFGCLYGLVSRAGKPVKTLPPAGDPYYEACWQKLATAHATVVEQQDQNVHTIWPGKGNLVFFSEELTEYAPSFFVMDQGWALPSG